MKKDNSISAFDTENHPTGEFIHGVVIAGENENVEVFKKSPELRKYVKALGGFCFANNLFYDFGNLYTELDWRDDILQINSGRTVIRQGRFIALKYKGHKTVFYDLFNYLRTSIEDIGEMLGCEKLPFDPENIDYCVRDTQIAHMATKQCIEFIESQFDLPPKPSTASFSKAIYNKMDYEKIPYLKGMDYYANGYFGGRTEAFYIGTKKMSVYDINSAYPYAMTTNIPFGEPKTISPRSEIRPTDYVECTVEIPDVRYGLLPMKYGFGGLCFPVGKLSGCYWGIELLTAVKHGANIKRIRKIIRYNRVGRYFKDYANMLYDLRLKFGGNDKLLKKFIKLILNSFYGKLASKFIVQKIFLDDGETRELKDDYIFKGHSKLGLMEKDYGFTKDSRVDIAGYITAFVRSLLLDSIIETNAYYCDTDSVFTSTNVKPRNIGKKLGQFKHEYTGEITIVGAKMYHSTDGKKIACKGVPKKYQKEALQGNTIVAQRPRLWLSAFKNDAQPNEWNDFKKTIKSGGQNRYGVNGWTQPFISKGYLWTDRSL